MTSLETEFLDLMLVFITATTLLLSFYVVIRYAVAGNLGTIAFVLCDRASRFMPCGGQVPIPALFCNLLVRLAQSTVRYSLLGFAHSQVQHAGVAPEAGYVGHDALRIVRRPLRAPLPSVEGD